ncbi:hypothetical protein A1O1_03540 [Capronia coronata CBS 617.96]|uniref:Amidohydrolase-related domain-containing protein n=1 Tax=Capronia coronata CBS 617.96 TaxID=1182541 RepID=W9YD61_9EURO|nr:uncharacterized protein A1O1_03540 [Capronia coronata CBS 617.96]EXJ90438.1 hypothetical protein A1O1_03540 [Capronia coronata CBS 617.96]
MLTKITNVRVFDGERVVPSTTVIFDHPYIISIGENDDVPDGGQVIDGSGMTLLPGLIDSHVHTKIENLQLALQFGITTELEMMGHWTPEQRREIEERNDVADLRTAEFGLTAPGGHPSELHSKVGPPPGKPRGPPPSAGPGHKHPPARFVAPTASTPQEAVQFVKDRVADGADYIKIMIEEGSVLESPGLPLLPKETLAGAVTEAHRNGKLVVAHVLTADATLQAIEVGADGLAHLFLDQPHTTTVVESIASAGAFVTPCLVLNSSIMGKAPTAFASDERVRAKLSPPWIKTLNSSFNTFPEGKFQDCLDTVLALHKAGVDILAGTDVSVPVPELGGLAHGASVHHELQLLVEAGLSATEALRAATSVPARRFGLNDRGKVGKGLLADLVLVDGDPTTTITDSLNVRGVWRRGVKLEV